MSVRTRQGRARHRRLAVVAALSAVGLAGCDPTTTSESVTTSGGTATVTYVSLSRSGNGTVESKQHVVVRDSSKHVVASKDVQPGKKVTFRLKPGTYRIVVTTADGQCSSTVTVHSSSTSSVKVSCG